MEHPYATWNDFLFHIIQKDVSFLVSSNFSNDEEQTEDELATLGQEMKYLLIELKEHAVNAVKGTSKSVDPNQKGRQNATRFFNHCRTIGHTLSWWRKKIRDEELKKVKNERTAEKKLLLRKIILKEEEHGMGTDSGTAIRILPTDTVCIIDRIIRTLNRRGNQFPNRNDTNWSNNGNYLNHNVTWRKIETLLVHHGYKDGTFHKINLFDDLSLFNLEIRHLENQTVI